MNEIRLAMLAQGREAMLAQGREVASEAQIPQLSTLPGINLEYPRIGYPYIWNM